MRNWPVFVTVLMSILLLPGDLSAQLDRGAIKGEIVDTQKASVPNAKLSLKEEATGVVSKTVSGASGQFNFLNLMPGVYTLTSASPGFSTSVQQHIVVGTGATVSLVVVLQPGQIEQTVTVSADTGTIQTQTSDIGTVISPEQIKDLPLHMSGDSRNPLSFVFLTPGVSGSVPGAQPDYRLHISGASSYSNEVYMDGIPVMATDLPGGINDQHPPLDAISQFKLVNNNQTAQYGLSSGVVSFEFKSGTNAFHGSLFEYLQNDALNAGGYVFNALRARTDCTVTPQPAGCRKPGLKQNEFGGTFGGPVRIPKLYNGRDRTFFFVDFTGFKFRPSSSNASLTTVPNKYRTGDFSQALGPQLTDGSGNLIFDPAGRPVYQGAIYNPSSAHTVVSPYDHKTYTVRDPFPGNIIPPNTPGLSKVTQNVLKYFPMADSDALFNNLVRRQAVKTDEHRVVVKIDEHLTDKHAISGSVFLGGFTNTNNGGLNLYDSNSTQVKTKQLRLSYNYTHSATLLNNLNVGLLRDTGFSGPLQAGPGLAALGLTGLPALAGDSPFPNIALRNQNSIGTGGASGDAENRYIVSDNLTLVRGSHTFTFGGELRKLQRNNSGIAGGGFNFEQTQSALNGTGFADGNAISLPAQTGNSVASFLFGALDFSRFDYPISQYYRWTQMGLYAQDDWKVNDNLTLNLGVRYDLQIPRTEKYGNVSTMDPTVPNPAAGNIPGAYVFYGKGPGRNGKARVGTINYRGFQPRIGFAYSPDAAHKTVLRGGFAITRPLGNDNIQGSVSYDAGYAGLATVNRPQDYVGSPAFDWDNPYPPGSVIAAGSALNPGILTGNDNPAWIGSDVGLPPTQIYWSMQVQQQMTNSMMFSIGYVGMHTYHLGIWSKPNQSNPREVQQKYSAAAAAAGLPLNEFLVLPIDDPRVTAAGVQTPWPGFKTLFGPGATMAQALRPTPQYGDTDHFMDPRGGVSYNGLQTSLQKRFSQGLTFLVSYTFSKTIGDVDSNSGPSAGAENAIFAGSFFQDYYNSKAERSVTSSDIPHVLALSYTYELPIGPGKKYLNHKGLVGKVTEGWSVSGIQQYQSGRPIHIEYDAFGASNPYFAAGDGFSFRPNIVPGQPFKNPQYRRSCSGPLQASAGRNPCQFYINPAAFVAPPPGEFGNAPNLISSLRMPAYLDEDLSIAKRTKLLEGLDLKFEANAFNVLNRTTFSSGGNAQTFIINLAPPNLSQSALQNSNTNFGIMTNQQNGPRIIQFGARLEF